LRDQAFDDFQSRGSGENSVARFELADFELHFICFRFANVGRIGHHEIETSGIDSVQQIGLAETNAAFELVACGVSMGHLKS